MTQRCPICLAVLEEGTDWQPQLWGLRGRTDDSIVVRQRPGETEAQLLERLDETCAGLAASGREVRTAVFACREPPDASALGCSVHLVARLLAKLTVSPGARLVLVTDKQRGAAVNGLLALAGTLIERWVSDGIGVELCTGSSCARAGLVRTQDQDAAVPTAARHAGPGLARAGRARRASRPSLGEALR
jgi:hypothetical protein